MTRIWHVGAWSRNHGDAAIQHAMVDSLERAAGEPLSWRYVDIQRTRFDSKPVDELNADADLLIVGGGGLLWQRPGTGNLSGWQWQVTPRDIVRIEVPYVLYGLGWTAFPEKDGTGTHPMLTPTVAHACERAALVSVRNEGTKAKVLKHGGKVDAVHADPALLLEAEGTHDIPEHAGPTVAVCWASDNPKMRYRSDRVRESFELAVIAALQKAVGRLNARVLLIEHIAHLDRGLRSRLAGHLGTANMLSVELMGYLDYPPKREEAPRLAGLYRHADVVLSMRKHGLIVGAGQGVPVVGLGDVDEVAWTADMLGGETCGTDADADRIYRALVDGLTREPFDAGPLRAGVREFDREVVGLVRAKEGRMTA